MTTAVVAVVVLMGTTMANEQVAEVDAPTPPLPRARSQRGGGVRRVGRERGPPPPCRRRQLQRRHDTTVVPSTDSSTAAALATVRVTTDADHTAYPTQKKLVC